jgi:hypothetical protein
MYGYPSQMKIWRAFHRMAIARASRRFERFLSSQLLLDLDQPRRAAEPQAAGPARLVPPVCNTGGKSTRVENGYRRGF